MLIDCNDCAMQGTEACDDCLVTALLRDMPDAPVELADSEAQALTNLAGAGMVPMLRLVRRHEGPDEGRPAAAG